MASFTLPGQGFVSGWVSRLNNASQDNLIGELTAFLAAVDLPKIDEDDPRHDHLRIYHKISLLRESSRDALSKAMSRGYRDPLSVVAETAQIAPELRSLVLSLERIENKITTIEQRTIPNLAEGVSVTVGPLSLSLETLRQLVVMARDKIRLDQDLTNVSVLALSLSRLADGSNELSKQLGKIIRSVPPWLRVAVNEVIRAGFQIANSGIELLRKVKKLEHEDDSNTRDTVPNESEIQISLEEVGKTLERARISNKIDVGSVSRALNIPPERVLDMEQGGFPNLGRTYALGYVKAYAAYLKMPPEPLLASLRAQLPHDWNKISWTAL
jgi:hypothetical protein